MRFRRPSRLQINMQKWFRSVALIRKVKNGKNLWLARECPDRPGVLGFISAQRLERESFRETIRREAAWVLELDAKRDLLVSNMAQLNLEFVACLPQDSVDSHVAVSFFLVEIYGKEATETVLADDRNHWLTSAEVCAGQTLSGQALDPRLIFLLDRAKVINAWD